MPKFWHSVFFSIFLSNVFLQKNSAKKARSFLSDEGSYKVQFYFTFKHSYIIDNKTKPNLLYFHRNVMLFFYFYRLFLISLIISVDSQHESHV